MLNAEESKLLDDAKVGDVWYSQAYYGSVRRLIVKRVLASRIELSDTTRINKKTGCEIGRPAYLSTRYVPATSGNVARFEALIALQRLQSEFRNLNDIILERHLAGRISADTYGRLIAEFERAIANG